MNIEQAYTRCNHLPKLAENFQSVNDESISDFKFVNISHLKGNVVDEFRLLDDSEDGVAADERLETFAPIKEVVVVEDAAAEVRRRESGGMLGMEVVGRRTDEPIA